MQLFWRGALLLGGLLLRSGLVQAQVDTTRFICYLPMEPMPELVSGGGSKGIIKAIQQRLTYPPEALRAQVEGRVFVAFVVTIAGEVTQIEIVKSLWAPLDSAVLDAVRHLPWFKPRLPRYGDVRYVAPVSFRMEADVPPATKVVRRRNSTP
ncbi:MAG: TonB family protein [Hymenobacter sp.]|nr:MAG: TonB family protein [Hymenobacter sp.]